MNEIYAYVASKGDLYSILLEENQGTLVQKTARMKPTDKNVNIRAVIEALTELKTRLNGIDYKVNFVLPNTHLEKWLQEGYTKPEYTEEFNILLDLFQSIPMQYEFLSKLQNKATPYLKDSYIVKTALDGADSLLSEFSED